MKNLTKIKHVLSSVLRSSEEYRLEKVSKYKKGIFFTVIGFIIGLLSIGLVVMLDLVILLVPGIVFIFGAIIIFALTSSKLQGEYNHILNPMYSKGLFKV